MAKKKQLKLFDKTPIEIWIKTKADEIWETKNLNILCDADVIEEYQSVFYRIKKEVGHHNLDEADTKALTDFLDDNWDYMSDPSMDKLQKVIEEFAADNQE